MCYCCRVLARLPVKQYIYIHVCNDNNIDMITVIHNNNDNNDSNNNNNNNNNNNKNNNNNNE